MENKDFRSETRLVGNRIILKNLTKRQKEMLSSSGVKLGGVGLGVGLFTLYSMNEPQVIPGVLSNVESTNLTSGILNESSGTESAVITSKGPIPEVLNENIPFGDAFKIAREICGSGGWFIWKGNVYNTFYKEEWDNLTPDSKADYLTSLTIDQDSSELESLANVNNSPENVFGNDTPVQTSHESDTLSKIISLEAKEDPGIESLNDTVDVHTSANEFAIDFNSLYKSSSVVINTLDSSLGQNNASANELIQGEIITLDDDFDLPQHEIFELTDDVEITLISDSESVIPDSFILDSGSIIDLPNEGSSESVNDVSITEHEFTDSTASEVLHHQDNNIQGNESEYPWGETIEKHDSAVLEEHIDDNNSVHVGAVIQPVETSETPWGEVVSDELNPISGVVTDAVNVDVVLPSDIHPITSSNFEDIKEFPWGEVNPNYHADIVVVEDKSNPDVEDLNVSDVVGVIVNDGVELAPNEHLPASFNDITEFPWGESIHDESLGFSGAIDGINNPGAENSSTVGHSISDEPH